MYGSWDMESNGQKFLSFWTVFCPLISLTTKKLKIFRKMEKLPGDIIILHRCNINENHMMYGSWDTEHVRQNFLPFWTIFCTFTPLKTWKIKKIFKKWKAWRYYHFTHIYHKWQLLDVWFLIYGAWKTEYFVICDLFLAFYTPNNPKNQNFEKMKKGPGILSF